MSTFIIAEAGVNHNGSLDTALAMVDAAVQAGADAVKFQTFKAERLVTKTAAKAEYQIENTGAGESQSDMLKRLELSPKMHRELFSYCSEKNIIFMSTPFDEESANMLNDLEMEIFKVPSGEITNKQLLQHIAAKGKEIILSTGMSFLEEVGKAVSWINEAWSGTEKKPHLTLLHCVSSYPADVEDSNLLAMKTMEEAFGFPVGYSDHTLGTEVAVAAVAIGAKVIEKHFTLDRNMDGPDHRASLEPDELRSMVTAIRNIEKAIGDGVKKPVKSEEDARMVVRRSLVAKKDLKSGDTITPDDLEIKRPGTGIPPEFNGTVPGMHVKKDIKADSIIRWEDLKDA
ncbi:MAG TPA: N-acetylneuraminate synthase [Nitrospirae bacterium]|nr:N-acetylneuraminate synthase [Nitrospirota bacterium]